MGSVCTRIARSRLASPNGPPTPSARTPLGEYLRLEWLPRKEPTWASGSRRYRRWTVDTLCQSSLGDAHRYGLIPDNPCTKVRLPPAHRMSWLRPTRETHAA